MPTPGRLLLALDLQPKPLYDALDPLAVDLQPILVNQQGVDATVAVRIPDGFDHSFRSNPSTYYG